MVNVDYAGRLWGASDGGLEELNIVSVFCTGWTTDESRVCMPLAPCAAGFVSAQKGDSRSRNRSFQIPPQFGDSLKRDLVDN